jgi:hypothetical protein
VHPTKVTSLCLFTNKIHVGAVLCKQTNNNKRESATLFILKNKMNEESLGIFSLEIDGFVNNDSFELENVQDDLVLRQISENFFVTEK